MFVLFIMVCAVSCSGGGDDGDDPARVVARRLLVQDAVDEEIDCITDELASRVEPSRVEAAAAAPSVRRLDVPTRRALLGAALACVGPTRLAGG